MKPTEQLEAEHGGITIMLRIMGKITEKLSRHEEVASDELVKILEFLQVFADKCHHGKEEEYLFPALNEVVTERDKLIITFLIGEHDQARIYIREFAKQVEQYKAGNKDGISAMVETMNKYIALLDQHIIKENRDLFPTTDMALNEEKQQELLKGFDKIEQEKIGAGKHEEFHRLLDELKAKYLAP